MTGTASPAAAKSKGKAHESASRLKNEEGKCTNMRTKAASRDEREAKQYSSPLAVTRAIALAMKKAARLRRTRTISEVGRQIWNNITNKWPRMKKKRE